MSQPRSSAIPLPRRSVAEVGLARSAGVPLLVFVAAFAFRWLSMGALENDHFVALARAHQVLHGDWPVRDFADPGQPLAYLTAAAAARLFGATLLTDVAVAITFLSLAAVLTYRLALRASGSALISLVAVAVELAAAPRLYNAGKVLIPLAAVALGWRYADAPSTRRLAALAAWTAIAGLWRHDYAFYIAAPTLGLLALSHESRAAIRAVALYVTLVAAFLLPWLVYVQWAIGIVDYGAAAARFAATEGQRTVGWPVGSWPGFLIVMAIPLVAAALARRSAERVRFPHIAYAASIALIANVVLLRDVIATRIPDVIGLTAVLAAWIAGRVVPKPMVNASAAIALVVVSALVATRLGSQGFGVPTPRKVVQRFGAVSTRLRTGDPNVIPNRERLPLIRYIASCTPEHSRVLVSGFGPEIPVLAHRAFAGGLPTWIPGYNTRREDVERAAAQLGRETVSIAVMLEGTAAFTKGWPALADELLARRFVERTWRLDGSDVVVWVPEDVAAQAPSAPPGC
jgi:hypothetical protein